MIEINDDLVNLIKLLGDRTRLEILYSLKDEGEMHVSSIEEQLNITQSHLSQQLKKLHNGNLLNVRKEGRKRYYEIKNPDVFKIIKFMNAYLSNTEQEELDEKMKEITDKSILDTLY